MRKLLSVLMLVVVVGLVPVLAQDTPVGMEETGVAISWPLPVSEVWGAVPVIGTVNVPDLSLYFIEAIALNDDLSIPQNAPWIPVSAASSQVVVNGVLGEINTESAPDGLYAIRVSVTTATNDQYEYVVSPIRLNNARYEAERERIMELLGIAPEPTDEPTPTPAPEVVDNTPRVVGQAGVGAVNVRRCDVVDNNACPIVGFLSEGVQAPALARSSNGTGWFQIRVPSGVTGWVSPTVVNTLGDFSSLPLVAPPARIPPAPTAVPGAGTVLNGLSINGGALTCAVTGIVRVNVHNPGTTTSAAGTVTVQNVALRTGQVTATSTGRFPAIAPGGNYVVQVALTVDTFFNEQHQIRATSGGQTLTLNHTLLAGNCAGSPTVTPVPTNVPSSRGFDRGECSVTIVAGAPTFSSPQGAVLGQIGPDGETRDASMVARVGGELWFEVFADFGPSFWVRFANVTASGANCLI